MSIKGGPVLDTADVQLTALLKIRVKMYVGSDDNASAALSQGYSRMPAGTWVA